MEQNILSWLNESNDSKFVTKKWKSWCRKWIIYHKEVLKPNLCHLYYGVDTYIIGDQAAQVVFKNYASFTKYIRQNDGTKIDDAEDLDLVMPLYNLIEYSSNYSKTTGGL